jgi:hypothetical protein
MNISRILPIAIAWPLFAAAASSPTLIAASGETTLKESVDGHQILVTIWTHEIAIGKPDPIRPTTSHNSCTYTRVPCSVVDAVQLVVDKNAVFVPRSAFSDWSDLTTAKLGLVDSHPTLTVFGGDASEAYEAKVQFDASRVIRRTIASRMDVGHPLEITTYYEVSLAD